VTIRGDLADEENCQRAVERAVSGAMTGRDALGSSSASR
jgi:hypothetical protein